MVEYICAIHHRMHLFVIDHVDTDAPYVAMHPDHRWKSRRQMEIGRTVLDAEDQQFRDVHFLDSLFS